MTASLRIGACLCAWLLTFSVLGGEPRDPLDDGPYVFDSGQHLRAYWVCNGQPQELELAHGKVIPARCGYPHPVVPERPRIAVVPSLPEGSRIVALSDIHGQYELLVRLLRANKVIDANDDWALGRDHLVIAGDVFDRGPDVTESLWLLWRLQRQAAAAGGSVHLLLGNHETMVMYGDLRYVHPVYKANAKLLGRAYQDLFARDSLLGQWLRDLPTLLKIGDTLFLHGGIAPENLDLVAHATATNKAYQLSLGLPKEQLLAAPATSRLYDFKKSPLWYRGYFNGQLETKDVRALVKRLGVKRIVVGHTTQKHISSLHGDRIIGIDAGLKNGETGELLFIEGDKLTRGLLDGSRAPLVKFRGASQQSN